jgi:glycosyltransferase involved in cell wall biosynthesis
MSKNTIRGLASVIIPSWNQIEYTRKCLSALFRQTGPNWELVVVNNGSTDGTGDYLAGVQDASPVPVTLISNATNRGFPAAINQGLQYARGEYLVLLNNDVVVTEGWLDQLVALTQVAIGGADAPRSIPKSQSKDRNYSVSRPKRWRGTVTVIHLLPDGESDEEGSRLEYGKIGLVGPMSNYVAPPQLVESVPYQNLDDMKHFARHWREEHRGKWFTVPKLSGFCLLMKRTVYDAIGGLDERFGLGFFDDDDLALRARQAGFELAVAHDLFVHHFGSRTFVGSGIDANKILDENATKFAAKWGDAAPRGSRVHLKAFPAGPERRRFNLNGSGSRTGDAPRNGSSAGLSASRTRPSLAIPEKDRARVSLTMIVRDEQSNLPTCLESVRGLFDEIVVLDTGSKDRTIEIARSFGARVFDFVWVDDFAAARNAALARATGDYAFWLDADDLIEPPERTKLEALLGRLGRGGETPAYVIRCACDPGPDGIGGDTVVDHIRLFPLIEGVRWTYRVHEQILPALKRAGVPVQWTDITVRHTGYVNRPLRMRKLDRDSRILREELAERPDDPFTLFNLGAIAVERAEWNESLGYLRRSLAGSAPTDSIVCKLYVLIARAHQMLGDLPSALKTCDEGLSLDDENAELWFRKAVAHRHNGEPADAERCFRHILTLSRPEKFASVDQGIFGHLTRRNLAALAMERGDLDEAKRHWQAVLAECPGDEEATKRLASL